MAQSKPSILTTWKKLTLKNNDFIPKILSNVKTILFQHFLIVFNYDGSDSEKIVAFDLKENQWLPVNLNGDKLELNWASSICSYGNHAIVIYGTSADRKESILNLLSISKDSNGIEIYHDRISFQSTLLRDGHSANISSDIMYLIGGWRHDQWIQTIDYINLSKMYFLTN